MPRALVVDDSRAVRLILRRTLLSLGFEVDDAGNGLEAIKKLEASAGAFDLALVDWNMPERNGLEFIRDVRARREFDSIQIVMVTTETEIEQMTLALEAGANEYVMKPFTAEMIEGKLRMIGALQ